MAKIRVEVEVPEGERCGPCRLLRINAFGDELWCPIFKKEGVHPLKQKLPECIAATVEEK